MNERTVISRFQETIEAVEALPVDDQTMLLGIVRRHLIQNRRCELAADVAEARDAYRRGRVRRGTVADLMKELDA